MHDTFDAHRPYDPTPLIQNLAYTGGDRLDQNNYGSPGFGPNIGFVHPNLSANFAFLDGHIESRSANVVLYDFTDSAWNPDN